MAARTAVTADEVAGARDHQVRTTAIDGMDLGGRGMLNGADGRKPLLASCPMPAGVPRATRSATRYGSPSMKCD